MKKKIVIMLLIFISVFSFTGCDNKNKKSEEKQSDALRFKEEYESLNGQETKDEKKYRELDIPSNNPFVYASAKEIVKRIDNKESFIVYFGYESCPWSRSLINTLIEAAKDNSVEKIYYVNVKNIRDVLEVKKGKVVTKNRGLEAYYDLLDRLDNVLKKYELTVKKEHKDDDDDDDEDDEEIIDTKEKRIYTPNVISIVEGKPTKLVTGISKEFKDPYGKLSDEVLEDAYKEFDKVLKEVDSSGGACSMDRKSDC